MDAKKAWRIGPPHLAFWDAYSWQVVSEKRLWKIHWILMTGFESEIILRSTLNGVTMVRRDEIVLKPFRIVGTCESVVRKRKWIEWGYFYVYCPLIILEAMAQNGKWNKGTATTTTATNKSLLLWHNRQRNNTLVLFAWIYGWCFFDPQLIGFQLFKAAGLVALATC